MAVKKYINTPEVAKLTGKSSSELIQLVKDGVVHGHQTKRGWWRFDVDAVEQYFEIKTNSSLEPKADFVAKKSEPKPKKTGNKSFIRYISDFEHYQDVFSRMNDVKSSLRISSADLKNFTVYLAGEKKPIKFCDFLLRLLNRGVRVQLLCMHPFSFYRWVSENLPELLEQPKLEIRQNDHVHMKVFIYDDKTAYIGSANLTGAAIGRRSYRQRNYEAGILVQNNEVFDSAAAHFKEVWDATETLKPYQKEFKEKVKSER